MRAIIKNCDEFYNTFQYVLTMNTEVKIQCNGQMVWLQVSNMSCTAIAEVKFPAEYFEEYVCESEVTVGIHVKTFLSILKNTYKKKNVTLKMQASEAVDYMLITVTQKLDDEKQIECAYQMKLVNMVSAFLDIPYQPIHSLYKLSPGTLKKWKAFLFGECKFLNFTPKEDALMLESETDMKHKLKLTDEISSEKWVEEAEFTLESGTETVTRAWKTISVGYANAKLIFDLLTFNKDVNVQFFIQTAPVKCSIKLEEGVNIEVFIAPRIGDDDDDEEEEEQEVVPVRAKKRKTVDEQSDEIEELVQKKKAMTAH